MTDRERRLADAIRRAPRQSPPPGLADAIKKDIPEMVSPSRRFPVRQGWLIAATLITMVGAGWLALQLISTDPSAPEVVLSERLDRLSKENPPAPDSEHLDDRVAAEPEAAAEGVEETMVQTESGASRGSARFAGPSEGSTPASAAPDRPHAKLERQESVESVTVTANAPPLVAQESAAAPRDRAGLQSPPPPPPPAAVTAPAPQVGRTEGARQHKATEIRDQLASDSVSEEDEDAALSYDGLREMIAAGHLPKPAQIEVGTLLNHFDYGDRPPRRQGQVSLFLEGGAAPFQPQTWRSVRIGIRSGSAAGPVRERAELEVTFDPEAVSLYRRVGDSSVHAAIDDRSMVIPVGRIPEAYARTWLFEVKLRSDIDLDQSVVSAQLRYTADDQEWVDRTLKLGHIAPTWSSSSTSIRSAVLIGGLAENFGTESRRIDDLEMLQLAGDLREAVDADAAVADLTRLIEETVRLQKRPQGRQ